MEDAETGKEHTSTITGGLCSELHQNDYGAGKVHHHGIELVAHP